MATPQTTDDSDAFTRAVQRVRAEFLEMPGLTLTVAQASRLWSFDASFCMAVLGALCQDRVPITLSAATGVKEPPVAGCWVLP